MTCSDRENKPLPGWWGLILWGPAPKHPEVTSRTKRRYVGRAKLQRANRHPTATRAFPFTWSMISIMRSAFWSSNSPKTPSSC